MALPAALLVPTVVACVIFIAYLIQTVLGLQALRVALQRSKSAQMAFRRVPWNAGTPFLQSALRSYGLLTAGTPWVAFAAAAGWALLLLPGLAFIHWEPAAFWAPAPWLSPTSALGRAEALRSASFPAPLDALELLVAPTDTSVSVLSFQHLDGLVNLHNAVTGAELCRKTGWAQASASWLSAGFLQCPRMPHIAPRFEHHRPISRLGGTGPPQHWTRFHHRHRGLLPRPPVHVRRRVRATRAGHARQL